MVLCHCRSIDLEAEIPDPRACVSLTIPVRIEVSAFYGVNQLLLGLPPPPPQLPLVPVQGS